MPSPVTPDEVAAAVPSVTGSMCERFVKALNIPALFYQFLAWFLDENGNPSKDFIADWCAQSPCAGTGTGTGGLAAPVISATDGTFSDKVQVTWSAITGATLYDVLRNSVNDPVNATVIANDITTTVFDDTTVVAQTYYYYWVRAINPTQTSNLSQVDRGHAGTISTTLPMITDLLASKGFGKNVISLVWTPVIGAETYDIHEGTSDDFSQAMLVDQAREPYDNTLKLTAGPLPTFVDNSESLVYIRTPPSKFASYYYWVIARRSGPPAESPPSNNGAGAIGWANGWGDGAAAGTSATLKSGNSVAAAGFTKVWVALYGGGGGGAGGDVSFGGGGGGGGTMISGWMNIAAGSKLRVRSIPEVSDTGNAPSGVDGSDSPQTLLEYSADGTFGDVVIAADSGIAGGGFFNGAGGLTAVALNGTLLDVNVFNGLPGKPFSGTSGGRAGCRFGGIRNPGAHFNNFLDFSTYASDGNTGGSGGGSFASATSPNRATGGKGFPGNAILLFRN